MPLPQRTKGGLARLVTKQAGARTRLDVFYQEGSAKIRIPESFDGAMEAVLINTSGGLTGGDRISWDIDARAQTTLTVTTQACERVYKSSGGHAEILSTLKAGVGATLHWLPQETILFDQSALKRRLEVDLAADAEFIGLEAVLIGRKAMGEAVKTGLFRDSWRVRRAGKLVHAEELNLSGDVASLIERTPVLSGMLSFATVLYIGSKAESLLGAIRSILDPTVAGASHWQDKLVIRLAAPEGFDLRKNLIPVISRLRNGAPPPKVWSL
jgi:urease accessory protein